jgi:hypothetical protein
LDQIKSDFDRPLITKASLDSNHQNTLTLEGHYLTSPGLKFNIKWKGQAGQTRSLITRKSDKTINHGAVYLTLKNFTPASNTYISIQAIKEDGRHSHETFSIKATRLLAGNLGTE